MIPSGKFPAFLEPRRKTVLHLLSRLYPLNSSLDDSPAEFVRRKVLSSMRSTSRHVVSSALAVLALFHTSQFIGPTQDHNDLLRCGPVLVIVLDHQETLAVRSHVVVG